MSQMQKINRMHLTSRKVEVNVHKKRGLGLSNAHFVPLRYP